jgi:hypothetical protein
MSNTVKCSVPQAKGEIVITPGAGEPLRFDVVAHAVDVPEESLDLFLTHVEGAAVVKSSPAAPAKENK